jgi:endonuclease/exonuclease/phosphatase family metal-dependent hydrolase
MFEITENIVENGNHYLWIYIQKLSINVGAIYKPDGEGNLNHFWNIYSVQLEKRKRTVVFGDFNIDLLSKKNYVIKYTNELQEAGYKILNKIDEAYNTRQTNTTKTILNHISTNISNHSFSLSILESSLSDHKQLYIEIGQLPPKIHH